MLSRERPRARVAHDNMPIETFLISMIMRVQPVDRDDRRTGQIKRSPAGDGEPCRTDIFAAATLGDCGCERLRLRPRAGLLLIPA